MKSPNSPTTLFRAIAVAVFCALLFSVYLSRQETLTSPSNLRFIDSKSQVAQVAPVATLSISPTSQSIAPNGTFNVSIVLNTGGQAVYGVDINRLRFNPSLLQVVDSDTAVAGVQISPGSSMALNVVNSVDNTNGTIQFSQVANPGSTFTGVGTLATITFRAVSSGTANVTIDFTSGSSLDSNVAGSSGDLLSSVGSGSYTITSVDSVAPSAPGTPVLAVISANQINLSWSPSTDAVGVAGYRVERCSGSATCSSYTQIGSPLGTLYSDTGLSASTIYRYRVRATDAAGNMSAYSVVVNATTLTPPDTTAPTISGITLSSVTGTGATISWTTNENADTQVFYGLTSGYGSQTTLNTTLGTSHTASISGLSPGTAYHYQVRSKDAAGNTASSVNNIFTTQSSADTTAPTVPSGVTATATGENRVQISWTASSDPAGLGQLVSGVTGYQIFRSGVLVTTETSTAYLDTGLAQNTLYSYQIAAVDAAGNVSAKSASIGATTQVSTLPVQRKVVVFLEGVPSANRDVSGTIEFIDPSNLSKIYQSSITTDSSGTYLMSVPSGLAPVVTLRPVILGYLSRILRNVDIRDTAVLDAAFATLPAGDFNGDQSINTVDYSYMNGKWGMADPLADINRDGTVNSLDFSYLSRNWLLSGE